MATITVSIDANGNVVCQDIDARIGENVTWVPDPRSVTSIQSITADVGSFNPAPTARNNWSGTIATDGPIGQGLGLSYTIVVNGQGKGVGQKRKAPKINIVSPVK